MLRVVRLRAADGPEGVARARHELQLVHHALARLLIIIIIIIIIIIVVDNYLVGGRHAGPHRVLKLQTLEVNPDLAHRGVALKLSFSFTYHYHYHYHGDDECVTLSTLRTL